MGDLLGRCVVRELDDIHVDSLGPMFADVSIIQLYENVVADNSVKISDSSGRQITCRFDHSSIVVKR